jgi:general secretion pathway protein G
MRRKAVLITLSVAVPVFFVAAVLVPCISVHSPVKARERILRQDVIEIRALISQYTLDLQRRPQSIDDLVTAGYLKHLPTDPMTGRTDTWVAEWSSDPKMPGIVGIRSGSGHR